MKHSLLFGIVAGALSGCSTQITLSDTNPALATCTGNSAATSSIELGGPDAGNDPLGYASFAVSGCALVYVNRAGDLVLRSRADANTDKLLEVAARSPRRPSAKAGLLTWEYVQDGISSIAVLDEASGERSEIRGAFHHAGEPRSTGTSVLFTAWSSQSADSDTDVYAYRRGSKVVQRIFGGRGQQRFADGNSEIFVASDFSEDPSGVFSELNFNAADTLVWREADSSSSVRKLPGKQAFPQVSASNQVIYLDWGSVRPEPKLSAYKIRKGVAIGDPALDVDVQDTSIATQNHMRPAVSGERIAFLDGWSLLVSDPGQAPRVVATGNFLATTLLGDTAQNLPAAQLMASQRIDNNRVVTRIIELR
jgi:hypothetical protein